MRGLSGVINELAQKYNNVKWYFVYIAEAHAVDEWPVQSGRYTQDQQPITVKQTKTVEERMSIAKQFVNDYGLDNLELMVSVPMQEDLTNLDINFEALYSPWPFRIYGFNSNKISFMSEPRLCETKINELVEWLEY